MKPWPSTIPTPRGMEAVGQAVGLEALYHEGQRFLGDRCSWPTKQHLIWFIERMMPDGDPEIMFYNWSRKDPALNREDRI